MTVLHISFLGYTFISSIKFLMWNINVSSYGMCADVFGHDTQ